MSAGLRTLVHDWTLRGESLVIDAIEGGGLEVTLRVERAEVSIELNPHGAEALCHALDTWEGNPYANRLGELEAEAAQLEDERDEALRDLAALRAQLAKLAEVPS